MPSVFCHRTPVTLIDPELPPALVYPVVQSPVLFADPTAPAPDNALARLLGPNRAAVLRAAAEGGTTGELASRVGVSRSSASEHATVLRDAGLIVSARHRNAMIHTCTPLGRSMLRSTL
ncbi:hypothetical protein GCM10010358_48300 [Streptomyces minutiscleroticus]|uniref:ArsR family transcriptional regulator n=1 Tax=Streptomyces minutiscleroticus TaxID=68238 RepID=A0A918NR06_9ACTN|nr:winged helix-turn-helix domain-containing protein [Streptomyces minutiscleroticus]GGX88686.1 hypothetical protein GCM10010358_48300 [Streptomyces minutiscleroticus]